MSWAAKLSAPYRVDQAKGFRMKNFDPTDTGQSPSKAHAQELLDKGIADLRKLQDKLYAQDRWALLVILQALDAAGRMASSSMSCPV